MSSWNQIVDMLSRMVNPQPVANQSSSAGLPGRVPPAAGLPPMLSSPPQPPAPPMAPMPGWTLQDIMRVFPGTPAPENPPAESETPHLLPQQFNWLGQVRPLGPGEYVSYQGNMPGTSSEQPAVVKEGNQWVVVPTLFVVNGKPQEVNDPTQALAMARQTGLEWPTFPSENAANQFVSQREAQKESAGWHRSDLQPPLWRYRK